MDGQVRQTTLGKDSFGLASHGQVSSGEAVKADTASRGLDRQGKFC
jgi:hypothetical protein